MLRRWRRLFLDSWSLGSDDQLSHRANLVRSEEVGKQLYRGGVGDPQHSIKKIVGENRRPRAFSVDRNWKS